MVNNNVTLIGRTTKDLELKKTGQGTSYLQFDLAIDRFGEGTDFIRCQAWKKSAEYLYQYAQKGSLIALNGRISTRSYEGQNGKVYVTEVVAESVKILQSKKVEQRTEERSHQQTLNNGTDMLGYSEDIDINTDELPFY